MWSNLAAQEGGRGTREDKKDKNFTGDSIPYLRVGYETDARGTTGIISDTVTVPGDLRRWENTIVPVAPLFFLMPPPPPPNLTPPPLTQLEPEPEHGSTGCKSGRGTFPFRSSRAVLVVWGGIAALPLPAQQ